MEDVHFFFQKTQKGDQVSLLKKQLEEKERSLQEGKHVTNERV